LLLLLLHLNLLFHFFGQVRVNVLRQVIFAIEALAALVAPVHFVGPVDNGMPLQVLLNLKFKINITLQSHP